MLGTIFSILVALLLTKPAAIRAATGTHGETSVFSVDSAAGERLLSKTRQLENRDRFSSYWMRSYSIKFAGCLSSPRFDDEDQITSSLVAKYKLCPTTDGCDECADAPEYLVSMKDFIAANQEASMEARQYNCQAAEERCEYQCQYNNNYNNNGNNNNNNQNKEYCQYQCMDEAEMSNCYNEQQNDDYDYEEMLDCRLLESENYYSGSTNYFVGAACLDDGVYLGTFTDSACTKPAESGIYEKYMGYSMDSSNLIEGDCVPCREAEKGNNQYGNDYYDEDNVLEICENLYALSGKCETNLANVISNIDESSCAFLDEKGVERNWQSRSQKVLISFFVLTTIILSVTTGLLACKLSTKLKADRVEDDEIQDDEIQTSNTTVNYYKI